MDYTSSPEHENARRVIRSLEKLGVNLEIGDQFPLVPVMFKHSASSGITTTYGVALSRDSSDIALIAYDVANLSEIIDTVSIDLLNEFNSIESDDFVCTGTLFLEDGTPQLRYYIGKNDHALQERMDECVRRISEYISDIYRVFRKQAPMSVLDLAGETPFITTEDAELVDEAPEPPEDDQEPITEDIEPAASNQGPSKTTGTGEATEKVSKKKGLLGRLFSK